MRVNFPGIIKPPMPEPNFSPYHRPRTLNQTSQKDTFHCVWMLSGQLVPFIQSRALRLTVHGRHHARTVENRRGEQQYAAGMARPNARL